MVGETIGRRFDRHLDEQELNALALASSKGQSERELASDHSLGEATAHLTSCSDCSAKWHLYQRFQNRAVEGLVLEAGVDCPREEDVDWVAVAAGLWPELRAQELILHAAQCSHCGPILRSALNVSDDPTSQEEVFLARLKHPKRPSFGTMGPQLATAVPMSWRTRLGWRKLAFAAALVLVLGVFVIQTFLPSKPISGLSFAELAVKIHRQHIEGGLALSFHAESEQRLNQWLKASSPLSLHLPETPPTLGEQRPYHLEGARLLRIGSKTAAYIAYTMKEHLVSLMVTPDFVASSSGGIEAAFQKVTFHYRMVDGYKVVTWSVHGLSYALVSEEGTKTQQSCMVCHSSMHDRDLTETPTPLQAKEEAPDTATQCLVRLSPLFDSANQFRWRSPK